MTRDKGREGERDAKVGGAGEGTKPLRGYPLRFVILRNPYEFPKETL